jgi:hypothetical protein
MALVEAHMDLYMDFGMEILEDIWNWNNLDYT